VRSFALVVVLACADALARPPPSSLLAVELVAELEMPVFLTSPAGDSRLFVVEKPGRVRVIEGGQLRPEPFLDLTGRVSLGMEQGLLGLAFHPRYATNGWLYVNYTDTEGDTRVVRYTVSHDPNVADSASAKLVLRVDQPYANHNGGMVAFGPDGMLYIGLGDGGSAGDPKENGQDPTTLLGAMLRIDVEGADPYAIPPDNPFVGIKDARPEIWAIGLRNPWRYAFDRPSGKLYIADVGQNELEEIDVVGVADKGPNFGWDIMEGTRCYEPKKCDKRGLVLPVLEYGRDDGCSVTGGYVYRGKAIPDLSGHYLYSDYCQGWLRSFRLSPSGAAAERREYAAGKLGLVTSFGEDAAGELYVMTLDGKVLRLIAAP
jgi:glucose/arabinose dehydrogenase